MQVKENNNCIEIENLSFSYNSHSVLENVSFAIKSGEYLGVIGPNGGGKTTLIKIILGLLRPKRGTVKIFGTDVKEFKEKSLVGYVPQRVSQEISQFPATVEEVVKSGRTARVGILKRFRKDDFAAVENAMKVADVAKYKTKLLSELSGGERQRVFIARALAGEPKILILDEPSVGVDLSAQEKFYTFIEELNQDRGLTIIFVSHDIDVVAHEVKSLLCLNKNLVCHGAPREFLKEEYLEKLYGKEVKFILHGH
jgi:zinc transport system ATP-binding protein